MYIYRDKTQEIKKGLKYYPVVYLTGPRQSGKSTLLQKEFKYFSYVTFDDEDVLNESIEDPRGFIEKYDNLIIDEAQYNPEIFRYLKVVIDKNQVNGQYILSGSQNFLLNEKISESLAGRVHIVELLPLKFVELKTLGKFHLEILELSGFYPRLHIQNIPPDIYYKNYLNTYIERDVKKIANIHNLDNFRKVIIMIANSIGSPINVSNISKMSGVPVSTINGWISILVSSYIVFPLYSYQNLPNKRITKAPKYYFYDTGILSSLLNIKTLEDTQNIKVKGQLFENLIMSEVKKYDSNSSLTSNMSYLRDSLQNEIDLLINQNDNLLAYEIKSSKTGKSEFSNVLVKFGKLLKIGANDMKVIYTNDNTQKHNNIEYIPYYNFFNQLSDF
jgi:predicted AAA+ superfamily ATPase